MFASDGESLMGGWFAEQKHFGGNLNLSSARNDSNLKIFKLTSDWLDVYFSGHKPDFTPPLAPLGTEFQKSVWSVLLEIPYGTSVTYGEIAAKIAGERKMSARAVGVAVGRNPISIVIPCHRVLGAGRTLVGYAGGMERKITLLTLEKIKFQI